MDLLEEDKIWQQSMCMHKDLILIVGVGRSGTSAFTRVLSLCGCTLPDEVLGDMDINPKGCWEPTDIWKLNNELMFRHGTGFGDPRMAFEEHALDEHEKENYIKTAQSFLTGCPHGQALLVKQPEIAEIMDLWEEAARRSEYSVKVVIPFRHPEEVFGSMAAMGTRASVPTSVEKANAFWLKRNLLAERHSRKFPRVFVDYSRLLKDWRWEVTRTSKILSIDLHPDEVAIDAFLTGDLHRNRSSAAVVETFGYSWITRVYGVLSAAGQDEYLDVRTMDEIYEAYRANERAFRIALDEFRRSRELTNSQQLREGLDRAPIWRAGREF